MLAEFHKEILNLEIAWLTSHVTRTISQYNRADNGISTFAVQLNFEQHSLNCTGRLTHNFFFPINTVGPSYPRVSNLQVSHPWLRIHRFCIHRFNLPPDQKQYFCITKCSFPTTYSQSRIANTVFVLWLIESKGAKSQL